MSDLTHQTKEECTEDAIEQGLYAFFAEPNELFLDFDSEPYNDSAIPEGSDMPFIRPQTLQALTKNGISLLKPTLVTTSKDGHGKHVYFRFISKGRTFDYKELAAIQAALHSDPVREILTILTRDFSALYETPDEAKKVLAWRKSFNQ